VTTTRILIVEDEAIVAADIERQIVLLGYAVAGIAATGDDAIALAERARPQLVLMDIRLRGAMDGIDAAVVIRERFAIPSVFLTAYATDEVVERAKRAAPLGYLIKPFDEHSLRTTIEIALHKDRLDQQLRLQSAALNAAANGIVITNRNGDIEWVNPAFAALTGYTAAEAIGRNPRDLVKSGAHDAAFYEHMWNTLIAGHVWQGELTNRRKDGTIWHEEQTITPVRDARGEITHFIGIKRDLTTEKHLREQFLQAQKMEAVGRLAGGVAHDFNNLLTVINGRSALALADLPQDSPLREEFGEILEAGQRAARLTKQLLSFSRKQVAHPVVISAGRHIASASRMLQRLIGEDIVLTVDASPDTIDTVCIDPGQFEQMLFNLAVNARDAMPAGGALTISVQAIVLDAATAAAHGQLTAGPFVAVRVTDTGHGMTADVRGRIFEPFFTTKALGKGTGLGLATVYGVIAQSGGAIDVESELHHGSTFTVLLPQATASADSELHEPREYRGTETVLLVEDEQGPRELSQRMLQRAGYTVLAAPSGADALTLLHATAHIDLLLTDVVMPGISGPDLAAQVVTSRPGTPLLFMSGYTADMLSPEIIGNAARFLAKPFTYSDLTRKVREAIDLRT
jgi:hypothetical protein